MKSPIMMPAFVHEFSGTRQTDVGTTTTFSGFGENEITGTLGTISPSNSLIVGVYYYYQNTDPTVNGLVVSLFSPISNRPRCAVDINGTVYECETLGAGWHGAGYLGVRSLAGNPFSANITYTVRLCV